MLPFACKLSNACAYASNRRRFYCCLRFGNRHYFGSASFSVRFFFVAFLLLHIVTTTTYALCFFFIVSVLPTMRNSSSYNTGALARAFNVTSLTANRVIIVYAHHIITFCCMCVSVRFLFLSFFHFSFSHMSDSHIVLSFITDGFGVTGSAVCVISARSSRRRYNKSLPLINI